MKTKEEILKQDYVTPKDIKVLVPGLSIETCREFIDKIRQEMEHKKLFVPPGTKPKRALTKLVVKKLGI